MTDQKRLCLEREGENAALEDLTAELRANPTNQAGRDSVTPNGRLATASWVEELVGRIKL